MKPFLDLHRTEEDQRIKIIGQAAMSGKSVGVLIDDEEDKIARYIKKVTEQFPGVKLVERMKGPAPGVVTLKFGLEQ
jgi:hypothetical protein